MNIEHRCQRVKSPHSGDWGELFKHNNKSTLFPIFSHTQTDQTTKTLHSTHNLLNSIPNLDSLTSTSQDGLLPFVFQLRRTPSSHPCQRHADGMQNKNDRNMCSMRWHRTRDWVSFSLDWRSQPGVDNSNAKPHGHAIWITSIAARPSTAECI